jgi:hypothetical protein
MKEGPGERFCEYCHANLTLGEDHDPDCDFKHEDPYGDAPDPYAEFEEAEEE